MIELETALIAADRKLRGIATSAPLSRDDLGLPYWKWMDISRSTPDSRVYPDVVNDRLFTDYIATFGSGPRKSAAQLKSALVNADVRNGIMRGFTSSRTHADFASLASGQSSIEGPHNSVHNAVGSIMADLDMASYDILFFMHHCEINRLYESYLKIRLSRTSVESLTSEILRGVLPSDGDGATYNPFISPTTKSVWMPKDLYAQLLNWRLYYTYDAYEPMPRALQVEPVYVTFTSINVRSLAQKVMNIHVYVQKIGETPDLGADLGALTIHHPNYAGSSSIFSREGPCAGCDLRHPFNLYLDINQALVRLGISRYDAKIIVQCIGLKRGKEIPVPYVSSGLPPFTLEHNLLEAHNLEKGDAKTEDVRRLQTFLSKFGHYKDLIDGDFGPVTEEAVKQIQVFVGLEPSGVVTPELVDRIKQARCKNSDETTPAPLVAVRYFKREMTYRIESPPEYLNAMAVRADVVSAFKAWDIYTDIEFRETSETPDVVIRWSLTADDKMFPFDGKGGILAQSDETQIIMDASESWFCSSFPSDVGFCVYNVIVHEIGHVLGLDHSSDPKDVMGPYYSLANKDLTAGDRRQLRQKVSVR